MKLPGKKPEIKKEKRVKSILSGASGTGKSFFACNFPNSYYWASEDGAELPQYQKLLLKNNGIYIDKTEGSQDFQTLIEAVKTLATTKHNFKNLIIDSFSKLYNIASSIAETRVGSDFGKDKKEANKPTRQLMYWLDKLDMNVIMICHAKDKWEKKVGGDLTFSGTSFDGYEKLEYDLDLWIETKKINGQRMFEVRKSRIESMPEGMIKKLDYETFAEVYGKEIMEKESLPIVCGTPEQLERVNELLVMFNVTDEIKNKWLEKVGVEKFEEAPQESIVKFIENFESKIKKENK